jgi:outer membrane protein
MAVTKAPPPAADPGLIISVGADLRVVPEFVGSDDYMLFPFPLVGWRRAGTPPQFSSTRDGFTIPIYETERFAIGPVAQFLFNRRESDNSALVGLGNVDATLELGGYIDYWFVQWLRGHAELRGGIGGHNGLVADFALDVVAPLDAQWTLSGGPRLRIASSAAVSPYFSVNPTQSVLSGLPVFNAGGGVQAVGAGSKLRYQWNPEWATHVFIEYDRLVGDTADSPLVSLRGSPDQFTFGAGFTYYFAWKP